jgi:hypothetical protein
MRRALATLAIAAAGLGVTACGRDEGDPIPKTQADRLVANIELVKRHADSGSCGTLLRNDLPALEQRAQALPSSVGSDVRTTITDAIAHLRELATQDCTKPEQQTTTDTTPSETSSETTAPTTDTTQSSDTSNTATSDTSQSTSDTTPPTSDTTPPPSDTTDTGGGGVTPPTTPPTTPAP